MKFYFNLLSILFSMLYFSGVAVAELPVNQEKTETATSLEAELSDLFPGCPLVNETVPTVIVETKKIQDSEAGERTETETKNTAIIENESINSDEETVGENRINSANESTINNQTEANNSETKKPINQDNSVEKTEETEPKKDVTTKKCPTPQEITRYREFAKADRLYQQGDKIAASKIYQKIKEPLNREKILENLNKPIYQVKELSPGGKVYWRTYQEGKKQQLESKIFAPLELLVTKQADFIPGHITYTEELLAVGKEKEAYAVMERAIGLYPNEVNLLKAKIATDIKGERWLEASISARQFALFNRNLPEAKEFTILANRYLEKYQAEVKEELTWNAIGNAITGAAGFALTGNLFGPISALDTTIMLLQGEVKLGDRFAKKAQKQLPMLADEEVNNYVQKIGRKIAAVAGRNEFQYEFFVIMDEELNAFALPGGKVFVNLGAIMKTDSEAELAGLLAHEVSHSVLSHGFQLATRGNLTSNVAQYIPYVGSTAGNLIVMNYSRDMERQADVFGTRILVAADYSADGIRNLMAKLGEIKEADEENTEPPAWLSTHPNTEQRVNYIEELVVTNNLNRYAYEGVIKHQKMKQKSQKLWQQYQVEQEEKEDKEDE